MSDLYNKLEELCRAHGVTITQMCKDSGAARGSLTDLKMGRAKSLSVDTLDKIARYFDVPIDDLIGSTPRSDAPVYLDEETKEIIDSLRQRPEMRTLFKVSQGASKEDVQQVVNILEKFKKASE